DNEYFHEGAKAPSRGEAPRGKRSLDDRRRPAECQEIESRGRLGFHRLAGGRDYAWLSARMGMVTLGAVAVSEAASMWQRPSKMPPGSITRQGECTSPVTTPLAWISTRPLAKMTPS